MIKIAPSMLASDFAKLGEEARRMEDAGADMLHIDVMDGNFVPNISYGACVIEAIRRSTSLPLDVHMMVEEPSRYVQDMIKAGATYVTIHMEATKHVQRALQQIRQAGALAGIALNPATSEETLRYVLQDVDLILAMTVNPGFGGQSLIPAVLDKIARIRAMLDSAGSKAELQVDGGVTLETGKLLTQRGATVLVAGTLLFTAPDPAKAMGILRNPC